LLRCHRGLYPQKGIEGKLETFRRSGGSGWDDEVFGALG
jgi:hypothetical protein